MTRLAILLVLALAACGQGGSQGAYVGGSAGANYRGDSSLR